MIVINKGQSNTVVVTVTEKTTITNPYYLFEFTNDMAKVPKVCIAANVSDATERYDKFVITEQSSSPNNLLGQITLTQKGFWKYKIYAQESSTNLVPADADELVEIGKCRVEDTISTSTVYEGQQTTYKVFE